MKSPFATVSFWVRIVGLVIVTQYILGPGADLVDYFVLTFALFALCEGSAWIAINDAKRQGKLR